MSSIYSNRRFPYARWIIWTILAVAWMVFIFYKSNQPYVEQDLKPFLADLIPESTLSTFTPTIEFSYDGYVVSGKSPYDFFEFFIRKIAHVVEFAILAFLLCRVFSPLTRRDYAPIVWAGVVSYVYALSDEWHQTFVAGRTGHFEDTLVDGIGIVLVMVCYILIRRRRRKKSGLRFG